MTRREQFIQSLREFADFLESHPTVMAPYNATMNAFVDSKDALIEHARAASWEKAYESDWFCLRQRFGKSTEQYESACITYDINYQRELVCRKIVTGTRLIPAQPERIIEEYEWVCDSPLLGGTGGHEDNEVRARDEEPPAVPDDRTGAA